MELLEAIKRRRSVRWFTNDPISYKDLLELVEAGIYAPSAGNMQNQRFLIITDKEALKKLGKIRYSFPYPRGQEKHPYGLIGEASAVIIVFIDKSIHRVPSNEYHIWSKTWIQNASASIQNILLAATDKGLGACWISAVPEMDNTRLLSGRTWREALCDYKIPEDWDVYGIVIIGYPRKTKNGVALGEIRHQRRLTARKPVEFYLAEVNR